MTPSAPATVFGLADVRSRGHVVVTILAAMASMILTAVSYGRLASLYPSAGSAYTYASLGIHPLLGFVAGWAMLLDYVVIPIFCVLYGTLSLRRALPWMPLPVGVVLFAGGITLLNPRGLRATARTNELLLAVMFLVPGGFIILAVRYIWIWHGLPGLFSIRPFYNPATFSVRSIGKATSFAALTYLGFDAVTTLAEEVENPRRNILLASIRTCLFTGVFGGLLVYHSQLAWPDYMSFSNIDAAFIDVAGRVGGLLLLQASAMMLVIANIGAGFTAQVGAARLLFGIGRENVFPKRIFGRLHPSRKTPDVNVVLIGSLAYLGTLCMSYELTAEILNFGAFLGFMCVNLAALWRFWVKRQSEEFWTFPHRPFHAVVWLSFLRGNLVGPRITGEDSRDYLAGVGVVLIGLRSDWFRQPLNFPDLGFQE